MSLDFKLKVIREELEAQIDGFPINACHVTTRIVSKLTGFEEVGGVYLPSKLFHAWNYDPVKKVYVDLSMDQFRDCTDRIVVLSMNNYLLKKTDSGTKLQRKMSDNFLGGFYDISFLR